MAGLAEVLNDPNYVNANAATKAAIFDKFSASDTNFTGANPETQSAIRTRFGLSPVSQPRAASSEIPIPAERRATGQETPPVVAPSLYQRALGVAEVVPGMLGGVVGGVVAPVAGLVSSLTSGKFGTRKGAAAGEQTVKRVQEMLAYKPVTQPGAENIQAVGEALAPIVGVPIPTLNALARTAAPPLSLVTNALRGEAQLVGGAVSEAAKTRAAARQVANEAKSYANAPQIDAAQIGLKLKLAADPSVSNPRASTRAFAALAGPKISADLSANNIARVKQLVRDDLAAPEGKITPDTIDAALNTASKDSYDVIRKLPTLTIPQEAKQALLNTPKEALIGGDAAATAVKSLVDEALVKLGAGRDGSLVLDDIRQLRAEANATQKAADIGTAPPKPTEMARAKAQMQIADILESVIDANAPKEVLPALLAGRTRMAQIYEHQRAFDFAGQKFDPQTYVKMYNERRGNMTGLGADIAQFAAANPAVMTDLAAKGYLLPRIVRGSLGATAGGTLGALTGNPVGIGAGMAAGIAAERGLGNLISRKMTDPAFQAKYAVPPDFRRPAPDTGLTLAPSWEPSAFPAREPPPTQAGNQFTLGNYPSPQAPAQLTMPSIDYPGYPKQPVDIVRRYQEGAEAAQIATETASRMPTGRGSAFDLDPITGRLRNVSQGMKGATPDVIESTGTLLQSAAKKITENKQFDMTMAEKIAWNNTKQFISEASPEIKALFPAYKTLSEQQIAIRMADRNIAELAVKKAREKAAGFDEISKRATDAEKIRAAVVNREKMLDLAESLGENLRARPVAKSSQGPKTRAAQRLNQLAPEESQNRLAAP